MSTWQLTIVLWHKCSPMFEWFFLYIAHMVSESHAGRNSLQCKYYLRAISTCWLIAHFW